MLPHNAMAEMFDLSMRDKTPIEKKLTLPVQNSVGVAPKIKTKKIRIRKQNKILPFVLLPLALPVHTLIHEGSHAAAAKLLGYKVTGLYPYPHYYQSNFYFGRVTTNGENLTGAERIAFYLAPHVTDIFIFTASDILLSTEIVKIKSVSGTVLFVFGIVAPVVDFSVGFVGGSDWDYARSTSKKASISLNIIGAAIMAVGIYRALTYTVRLFK